MARRLPAWLWIRAVRSHGPAVSSIRSVLMAMNLRMDKAGEAFPKAEQLAADTALNERTVREALLEARRLGWLAVVDRVEPGRSWRRLHYFATVPGDVDLRELGAAIGTGADLPAIAQQLGECADPSHGASRAPHRRGARRRRATGAAEQPRSQGPGMVPAPQTPENGHEVRAFRTRGPGMKDIEVRAWCPPKFLREETKKSYARAREAARGASRRASDAWAEPTAEAATDPTASDPADTARQRVAKIRQAAPDMSPGDVARAARLPLETVAEILRTLPRAGP